MLLTFFYIGFTRYLKYLCEVFVEVCNNLEVFQRLWICTKTSLDLALQKVFKIIFQKTNENLRECNVKFLVCKFNLLR